MVRLTTSHSIPRDVLCFQNAAQYVRFLLDMYRAAELDTIEVRRLSNAKKCQAAEDSDNSAYHRGYSLSIRNSTLTSG